MPSCLLKQHVIMNLQRQQSGMRLKNHPGLALALPIVIYVKR